MDRRRSGSGSAAAGGYFLLGRSGDSRIGKRQQQTAGAAATDKDTKDANPAVPPTLPPVAVKSDPPVANTTAPAVPAATAACRRQGRSVKPAVDAAAQAKAEKDRLDKEKADREKGRESRKGQGTRTKGQRRKRMPISWPRRRLTLTRRPRGRALLRNAPQRAKGRTG